MDGAHLRLPRPPSKDAPAAGLPGICDQGEEEHQGKNQDFEVRSLWHPLFDSAQRLRRIGNFSDRKGQPSRRLLSLLTFAVKTPLLFASATRSGWIIAPAIWPKRVRSANEASGDLARHKSAQIPAYCACCPPAVEVTDCPCCIAMGARQARDSYAEREMHHDSEEDYQGFGCGRKGDHHG